MRPPDPERLAYLKAYRAGYGLTAHREALAAAERVAVAVVGDVSDRAVLEVLMHASGLVERYALTDGLAADGTERLLIPPGLLTRWPEGAVNHIPPASAASVPGVLTWRVLEAAGAETAVAGLLAGLAGELCGAADTGDTAPGGGCRYLDRTALIRHADTVLKL